jgi:hypothetical protein
METPPPAGKGDHPLPGSSPAPTRPRPSARGRWLRVLGWALAGILGLMLLVQFGGSPLLTRFVNRKLAALPGYAARVERLRILPWLATVKLENFVLSAREAKSDDPILRLPRASLALSWSDLLRGRVHARALVEDTALAIRPEPITEEPGQSEEDKERAKEKRIEDARRWQATLRNTFPIELSRLEIRGLQVRYLDTSAEPHAELKLDQVHVVMKGLRNRPQPGEGLPATLVLDAQFPDGGNLHVTASADPWMRPPRFAANMEIRGLALPPLDGLVRDQAGVSVSKGTFEIFAEVNAAEGGYTGYLKPFFQDLEFEPLPEKNIFKQAAVKVVDAVTSALENEEEKVATKIPFEGNFETTGVEVWTAVENLLRNAFVQALREGLERQ